MARSRLPAFHLIAITLRRSRYQPVGRLFREMIQLARPTLEACSVLLLRATDKHSNSLAEEKARTAIRPGFLIPYRRASPHDPSFAGSHQRTSILDTEFHNPGTNRQLCCRIRQWLPQLPTWIAPHAWPQPVPAQHESPTHDLPRRLP